MIEVERRLYPSGKFDFSSNWRGIAECANLVYFSPWSGEVWARIDLGRKEWVAARLPRKGEPPYLSDYPNGSLYTDYDQWVVTGLPLPLLVREFSILIDLQSPIVSLYNYPTFTMEPAAMSPSLMDKIAAVRTKVLDNTATEEELREALRLMRADRANAARSSERKKAAAQPMDADAAVAAIFG